MIELLFQENIKKYIIEVDKILLFFVCDTFGLFVQ